jgi:hypothetical protein
VEEVEEFHLEQLEELQQEQVDQVVVELVVREVPGGAGTVNTGAVVVEVDITAGAISRRSRRFRYCYCKSTRISRTLTASTRYKHS